MVQDFHRDAHWRIVLRKDLLLHRHDVLNYPVDIGQNALALLVAVEIAICGVEAFEAPDEVGFAHPHFAFPQCLQRGPHAVIGVYRHAPGVEVAVVVHVEAGKPLDIDIGFVLPIFPLLALFIGELVGLLPAAGRLLLRVQNVAGGSLCFLDVIVVVDIARKFVRQVVGNHHLSHLRIGLPSAVWCHLVEHGAAG